MDFTPVEFKAFDHRSKILAQLIAQTPYRCVYDFGCGYCKLRYHLGGLDYVGFDRVPYTPEVRVMDLRKTFPETFAHARAERIAISAGLIEYLPSPFAWISKVLEHFDSFYFTYGRIPVGGRVGGKYQKTIVRSPNFERQVEEVCAAAGRRLVVSDFPPPPKKTGKVPQNLYLVTLPGEVHA